MTSENRKFKTGDVVGFYSGYGFGANEKAVVTGYRKGRYTLQMKTGSRAGYPETAPANWLKKKR